MPGSARAAARSRASVPRRPGRSNARRVETRRYNPRPSSAGAARSGVAMFDFSAEAGFLALFIASFIAATVLPGGSEVVLIAVIAKHPDSIVQAVAVATAGNTLGGATSYLIGRLIPNRAQHKAIIYLHKYGYWALLFSWVPLFGDALCVGAGWLRFNPWVSLVMFAVGKLFRYVLVAGGWAWLSAVVLPMFGVSLTP